MPFNGMDPIEEELSKRVQLMSPDELVSYIKMYMRVMHDLNLVTDGIKERSVMRGLQGTYGPDAGLIIKWVLWKYNGIVDGKPISYFDFTKGHKWWTDNMYTEMQLHKKELEKMSQPYEKRSGHVPFTSLKDL